MERPVLRHERTPLVLPPFMMRHAPLRRRDFTPSNLSATLRAKAALREVHTPRPRQAQALLPGLRPWVPHVAATLAQGSEAARQIVEQLRTTCSARQWRHLLATQPALRLALEKEEAR